jgi:transposase
MKDNPKKRHNQVTFKAYEQHQQWLLPPSLEELIPEGHIVRLVSRAIDGMKLEPLLNAYDGGGASNYHPRMLLKVLVYGYIDRLYSSRRIAKAVSENINFMWLSGMQTPDHNTINRFRKGQLKQTVKAVFAEVLLLLIEEGLVRLEDYHVDGTKIESAANRYTFVWAKRVEKDKARLLDKINALLEQIEQRNEQEEGQAQRAGAEGGQGEKIVDSARLNQTVQRLNEQLEEDLGGDKKLRRKLKTLGEEHLPKLQQYEEHEAKLDGRNSYSKTDPDATFMRMKEDHMRNGQLKPGYNLQAGTSDQFIVNYTIHQSPTDTPVLKEHLEDTRSQLESIQKPMPRRASADAGYGSEENYAYLEQAGMEAYVKYPGFYQEQKKSVQQDPFRVENLYYNGQEDYYVCPMGQHLTYRYTTQTKNKNGYPSTVRTYQARRCEGCPLRGMCHRAKTSRVIQVNPTLNKYKAQARQRLWSLRGIKLRHERSIDVEPVFGQIKWNRGFKRFLLRGMDKVTCEFGLLAIAHNLKKWWARLQQGLIVPIRPGSGPANSQKAQKMVENGLFWLFDALNCCGSPQTRNLGKPALGWLK